MYGREELDVNKLVYATDIDTMLVDCEGTEVWPQDSDGCEYYFKSQADKVMDAMEAHIKELETKLNDKEQCCKWCSNDARIAGLHKRIAELEAVISKMETTTPKWISVEDVLPQWGKLVKIKFKDGKEDERRFSADYKWVSKGMQTCESVSVTHWMPLPYAPTTEDSSATEKENR